MLELDDIRMVKLLHKRNFSLYHGLLPTRSPVTQHLDRDDLSRRLEQRLVDLAEGPAAQRLSKLVDVPCMVHSLDFLIHVRGEQIGSTRVKPRHRVNDKLVLLRISST